MDNFDINEWKYNYRLQVLEEENVLKQIVNGVKSAIYGIINYTKDFAKDVSEPFKNKEDSLGTQILNSVFGIPIWQSITVSLTAIFASLKFAKAMFAKDIKSQEKADAAGKKYRTWNAGKYYQQMDLNNFFDWWRRGYENRKQGPRYESIEEQIDTSDVSDDVTAIVTNLRKLISNYPIPVLNFIKLLFTNAWEAVSSPVDHDDAKSTFDKYFSDLKPLKNAANTLKSKTNNSPESNEISKILDRFITPSSVVNENEETTIVSKLNNLKNSLLNKIKGDVDSGLLNKLVSGLSGSQNEGLTASAIFGMITTVVLLICARIVKVSIDALKRAKRNEYRATSWDERYKRESGIMNYWLSIMSWFTKMEEQTSTQETDNDFLPNLIDALIANGKNMINALQSLYKVDKKNANLLLSKLASGLFISDEGKMFDSFSKTLSDVESKVNPEGKQHIQTIKTNLLSNG